MFVGVFMLVGGNFEFGGCIYIFFIMFVVLMVDKVLFIVVCKSLGYVFFLYFV